MTPSGDIWIGLDTGGTYTDAVALDGDRRIVATAKALTTHWDLAVGLGEAVTALLQRLPSNLQREQISLVSVSTTLATNAVVENRFSPICTMLVGFDDRMTESSGLQRAGNGVIVRVRGGHDATGIEAAPLDEAAVDAAVLEFGPQVQAFAVAALFSVRNNVHERRVRDRIRALSGHPVTCSHELSSQLDAPKRALTAALNARLTPQIRQLLDALNQVLARESIAAPLMIVKGDGTLMRAEVALECPVETVLSGPAASVVGAGFLCGEKDFAVADMGGTTTDVAVVIDGAPVIRAEGAVIGGWRTMVQAVDVRTCGLGGDSQVLLDRHGHMNVGPRKAMPLSLLAHRSPEVLAELRLLASNRRPPPFAPQFAYRNPGRDPNGHLDSIEARVWSALATFPRRLDAVAQSAQGVDALRRLVDRGLATLSAFTPSDAMHVLGRQHNWNVEAARLGASVLATEQSNAAAQSVTDTPEKLCERVYEHVVREAARIVIECALAHDPGVEAKNARWGPLSALIEDLVAGRRFSRLIDAQIRLSKPLIAIGAPAATYYPEVAQRLGAVLRIPEHGAVCNAVGAVAGVVSETCEVLVNQSTFNVFRVHDPDGSRDYADAEQAVEEAKRVSRVLALRAAQRAGACDPHVVTSVVERRAHGDVAGGYLAEATARSRATGRPSSGRAALDQAGTRVSSVRGTATR